MKVQCPVKEKGKEDTHSFHKLTYLRGPSGIVVMLAEPTTSFQGRWSRVAALVLCASRA